MGLDDTVTIALTGVLLFVVLFYVYPLKFIFTWLVDMLLGGSGDIVRPDGTRERVIEGYQTVRLMQIYSGGVVAVFGVFTLLYVHAYRIRDTLQLSAFDVLETRISVIDNAGFVAIGLVSVAIATIGGPSYASAAGMFYVVIGPMKALLGYYGGLRKEQLMKASTADTLPA